MFGLPPAIGVLPFVIPPEVAAAVEPARVGEAVKVKLKAEVDAICPRDKSALVVGAETDFFRSRREPVGHHWVSLSVQR